MKKGPFIVVMAAGDDDAKRSLVDVELFQRFVERPDEPAVRKRKPLGVAAVLAIVDDPNSKANFVSQLGHFLPDVPSANDH